MSQSGRRTRVHLVIRLLVDRGGGAERLYCKLADMLLTEGYEVSCLHFDKKEGKPFYPLAQGVRLKNLAGIKASRLSRLLRRASTGYRRGKVRAPVAWLAKNQAFVRRLHREFTRRAPDVVISFMPPANTPALLAGRLSGVKVIPTNHSVPEQDYRSKSRWDQNPIDRFLRLKLLDHAFRVQVLFPEFGEWFPSHIRRKIRVIENYVTDEFGKVPAGSRKKRILAVGLLSQVKNYVALIDAWALLRDEFPDWEVLIYGDGPQRKFLRQRIIQKGVANQVKLKGRCSNIEDVYREGEILCHPALFEGFGLSVAEALVCGLPVVAYADCAGVNQFVHHDKNGLMVPRQEGAAGMAAALGSLMRDEALRERLRKAAPASVARFSRRAYFDKWLALIEDAVND